MTRPELDALLDALESEPLDGLSGQVSGAIRENSRSGLPLALEFQIDVALEPLRRPEAQVTPRLLLSGLELGVVDWASLSGAAWVPPKPAIWLADGEEHTIGPAAWLDLGSGRVEVTCEEIRFGPVSRGQVPAAVELAGGARMERHRIEALLRIGPIRVAGDMGLLARPRRRAALELARRFLDLEAFDHRIEDGVVCLYPRGDAAQ